MEVAQAEKVEHKFPYRWNLADGYPDKGIEYHGMKVFGTFICGGGSTMGYKLAGYDHLGGVEIDKKVAEVYHLNHKPKHLFVEDLRAFNKREDLPRELYNLDLLDGSPPCSSFSMSGNREKDWGNEKVFREGQAMQTLDDLVFVYCETIKKLQPKVAILENVKGLIQGNAKYYCRQIINRLESAGYKVQVFLFNAATMGVPQMRERVFFLCRQTALNLPDIKCRFKEKSIPFKDISDTNSTSYLTPHELSYYVNAKQGQFVGKFESNRKYYWNRPANTIVSNSTYYHPLIPRHILDKEFLQIASFPSDYNFNGMNMQYLTGMSVPPVMTAQIAHQIYLQWLSKIPTDAKAK
jgi:DNA (cytosine-5)-methyltransferase 1